MGSSKKREPSPSSSSASEPDHVQMQSASSSPEPSKKRKRNAPTAEELEIDVNLPEPLSKAEARKAKKAKTAKPSTGIAKTEDGDGAENKDEEKAGEGKGRTVHGIWIGNLPFTADKTVVRVFFTRQGQIPDADITRVHMPAPQHAQPGRVKPSNKGFAYVDFSTKESQQKAIALSESLMTGRKVLIKDSNSYEGRPSQPSLGPTAAALSGTAEDATPSADGTAAKPGKPIMAPSKRVFVGNLGFDITKEDLETHFAQAGEIEDVHMATFQDTGKCKGFAWVRFVELEAAQGAVQGFIFKEEPASEDEQESTSDDGSDDDDEDKSKKTKKAKKTKKPNKRKWFLNRLQGRPLRCEFAEDASTRYKKRFGKGGDRNNDQSGGDADSSAPITEVDSHAAAAAAAPKHKTRPRGDKDARQEQRRQKHMDARKIKPGAALANAPRASGGIVRSEGKKISFDE